MRDAGETDLYEDYAASADTFLSRAEDGAPDTAWRSFFDRYNGEGAWAALPEKTRTKRLSQTEATADAFRANLANPMTVKRCRSLRLPVLVISGSETTAPDKRLAEILAAEIAGATHVVIAGAGHMSPLTHPAEVAAAIQAHAKARAPV